MLSYLADPGAPSQRETVYTEMFTPNGGPINPYFHHRAVRGPRYKLVRWGLFTEELYDLELDPFEHSPLDLENLTPEQTAAFEALKRLIDPPGPAQVPSMPEAAVAMLGLILASVARLAPALRSRRPPAAA
jgi:hypothetical protein